MERSGTGSLQIFTVPDPRGPKTYGSGSEPWGPINKHNTTLSIFGLVHNMKVIEIPLNHPGNFPKIYMKKNVSDGIFFYIFFTN
jgi:hypothetical protein